MFKSKNIIRFLDIFIFGARLMFIKLRQIFIKTLIFYDINPKHDIQIKKKVLSYTIDKIFIQ